MELLRFRSYIHFNLQELLCRFKACTLMNLQAPIHCTVEVKSFILNCSLVWQHTSFSSLLFVTKKALEWPLEDIQRAQDFTGYRLKITNRQIYFPIFKLKLIASNGYRYIQVTEYRSAYSDFLKNMLLLWLEREIKGSTWVLINQSLKT